MNKNIILGVSGGISAYKSPEIVRRLREVGADVRVVMTESAQAFITPLTLQTVSGHAVYRDLFSPEADDAMDHIALARWADLILIAPASANVLARLAYGFADDLLSTLCLATAAPIALAPAMNQQMWLNSATQQNKNILIQRGVTLLGPGEGDQACGENGPGRMLEPDDIVSRVASQIFSEIASSRTSSFCAKAENPGGASLLDPAVKPRDDGVRKDGGKNAFLEISSNSTTVNPSSKELESLHIVITAGPTQEAIDPVRYLSNRSSGKMGYALAQAAVEAGATVTLISGPTYLPTPARVKLLSVETAEQMLSAVMRETPNCDIFISAAAVSDYRCETIADKKMKKKDALQLNLVKNPDILAAVAAQENSPFTVGFAAETHDVEHYAKEKLRTKNIDMIAANDVSKPTSGFNVDENSITLIWKEGQKHFDRQDKTQLARKLIRCIKEQHNLKSTNPA